uniref:Uncharacterized protein n=1 Tax=Meloidogyne enterolobii TaxID=390850 RepID=A0A6V7W2C0_MELEN|nr:unnamed protein product [Meloidogyne enterolobii]
MGEDDKMTLDSKKRAAIFAGKLCAEKNVDFPKEKWNFDCTPMAAISGDSAGIAFVICVMSAVFKKEPTKLLFTYTYLGGGGGVYCGVLVGLSEVKEREETLYPILPQK